MERGAALPAPFATAVGAVGLQICFDVRFAEGALALRARGAQLLTYPSAFTVPTGRAHWRTLLRARAVETQSFVVAAAQCGAHNARRVSYGHGLVVGPWGDVLVELGGVEEWTGEPLLGVAEIDLEVLRKVRTEMPLVRRTDVYPEL